MRRTLHVLLCTPRAVLVAPRSARHTGVVFFVSFPLPPVVLRCTCIYVYPDRAGKAAVVRMLVTYDVPRDEALLGPLQPAATLARHLQERARCPVPKQMWAGVGAVPVQMWQGRAQPQGRAESRCRRGSLAQGPNPRVTPTALGASRSARGCSKTARWWCASGPLPLHSWGTHGGTQGGLSLGVLGVLQRRQGVLHGGT